MIRFSHLLVSLLAVTFLLGPALAADRKAAAPSNRPNVLVIITDDK